MAEPSASGPASRTRPDGTFRDDFYIERGHWEAKGTDDDLEAEIKKKIARGYPLTNIIFEDTRAARLYQNGKHVGNYDLTKSQSLCDLLTEFFAHTEPAHDNFEKAVDEFKQRVPDLARGLVELIAKSHKDNPRFIAAFNDFFELCKSSLNPNLSAAAVDEMLVQHLLTERLIRTIFDNQDFTRRIVIAAELDGAGKVRPARSRPRPSKPPLRDSCRFEWYALASLYGTEAHLQGQRDTPRSALQKYARQEKGQSSPLSQRV